MQRLLLTLLLALCGLISTACGHTLRIPGYQLLKPVSLGRFAAGVGKAEITPPPGIPLGGHGPGGRVARGYWTRLYARAFYFQDEHEKAVALVSCDLFLLPAGLRAKVLEIVNRTHRLEDGELIISATHTHHSPANYASAPLYNSFAGPLPHFEPRLFEFLAAHIAVAITCAIDDARRDPQARDALELFQTSAAGVQRNRAIAPFFRNPSALRDSIVDAANAAGATCPDGGTANCPRYLAVDPVVTVIKVLRNGAARGLLTFYAVHPTAMTHDAELYSGDLAGIAMLNLEASEHVIAGFFNGAEGDVSPDWLLQDRDDTIDLAGKLAKSVQLALRWPPLRATDTPAIELRWSRVPYNAKCGTTSFAPKPLAGAAELGGAEDGRTVFYNYGWRPEARKSVPAGAHGPKEPGLDQPLADALTSLDGDLLAGVVRVAGPTRFVSSKDFPQEIPVAIARIGTLVDLATVPAEATTAVGKAIRDQVVGRGTRPIAIIGLANEYVGYATTREEYELQQYEGASTLLGPQEADMLVCLLNGAQPVPAADRVSPKTYHTGPVRKHAFGPDTLLVRRPRNMVDEDLEPLIPRRLRRLESRVPRFEWSEERTDDWNVPKRAVGVLARPIGSATWTEVDNDRGLNILTVLVDGGPPGREGTQYRRYAALWLPQAAVASRSDYAFHVTTPAGVDVCSETFRIDGAAEPARAPVMPIRPGTCPSR
jgi:neutral ceramidase